MCEACQSITEDNNPTIEDNGGISYNTYVLPYQY